VSRIAAAVELAIGAVERLVAGECPEQLVMAGAWFVRAGQHRGHDGEPGRRTDAIGGDAGAGRHAAATI